MSSKIWSDNIENFFFEYTFPKDRSSSGTLFPSPSGYCSVMMRGLRNSLAASDCDMRRMQRIDSTIVLATCTTAGNALMCGLNFSCTSHKKNAVRCICICPSLSIGYTAHGCEFLFGEPARRSRWMLGGSTYSRAYRPKPSFPDISNKENGKLGNTTKRPTLFTAKNKGERKVASQKPPVKDLQEVCKMCTRLTLRRKRRDWKTSIVRRTLCLLQLMSSSWKKRLRLLIPNTRNVKLC